MGSDEWNSVQLNQASGCSLHCAKILLYFQQPATYIMSAPLESQSGPVSTSMNESLNRLPERSSPSGISVLIVGAGVAGLMACLECWRNGHEVRIIEKSPSRLLSGNCPSQQWFILYDSRSNLQIIF